MTDNTIGMRERRVVDDRYSRGSKYLEDLESNEAIHFCYRWNGLPNARSVLKYFEKTLGKNAYKQIKVKKIKEETEDKIRKIKVKRAS